jgi:hypothetical protein
MTTSTRYPTIGDRAAVTTGEFSGAPQQSSSDQDGLLGCIAHTDSVNWDSAHIVIVCLLKSTILPSQENEFVSFFRAQQSDTTTVSTARPNLSLCTGTAPPGHRFRAPARAPTPTCCCP